ncbi:cation transporter [Paenibacillus sp. IB182496]|uniref:Cation transporter n=1 Tax=Paenibacillus sabuli TaxID=2772509 RepID=A0A927BPY0_9BACL|nr:cation transporter [Paenibacillus sabuli]MBD2844573.1 cation transporter [Paenibacillus sabuli]
MAKLPQNEQAESSARAAAGSAGLALLKAVAAAATGSAALLADAIRSGAQAAEGAAPALMRREQRLKRANRSDRERGRSMAAVTLVAGLIIMVLSLELGLEAIRMLLSEEPAAPRWWAALIVLGAYALGELVLPRSRRRVEQVLALIALIGTGGAYLGAVLELRQLLYLDPAAALAIAALTVAGGYRLISGMLLERRGAGLREESPEEMTAFVQRIEGVITIEEIHAWERGHYVAVEMRISVNPRITVLEAHEIAKRTKELLLRRFLHVTDVTVTVDPYDPGYPYKSNHDPNQQPMPTLLQ